MTFAESFGFCRTALFFYAPACPYWQGGDGMERYTLCGGRLQPGAGGAWGVWRLEPAELGRAAVPHAQALARRLRGGGTAFYPDCIQGTAVLPGADGPGARVGFCLCARALWLAAEGPLPLAGLPLAAVPLTPAGALLALLRQAAESAVPTLQRQEDRLARLEDALGRGHLRGFGAEALAERRALAALHGGWAARAHLAPDPPAAPGRCLGRAEPAASARFAARAARLRDEIETLREYTMQLWQLYHANIELRQNRVTTWLTVVATVFLPLDLVTGWYGMNFADMLAPNAPWGYPAVCALCAALALGGVRYCRRKGML